MRIRKRWPPPPALTPTVMSSYHHHHQCQKDNGHVKAPPTHMLHLQDSSNGLSQEYVVNGETAIAVNQRTGSLRSPELSTGSTISSPASRRQGQWCKEELDFPPKKRRVSLTSSNTRLMVGEGKKMDLSDKKSSKNKTWDDDEEKDGEKNEGEINGGNIMEKSWQCSRSNGRGWRCSQAARVGFSMCEHHCWRGKQMTRRRKATGVNGKKVKTSYSYLVDNNKVNANYIWTMLQRGIGFSIEDKKSKLNK